MTIYQRLKDLREDKDLSQAEVGKILGLSQSDYSKYERGKIMMGIDKYIILAKYYNISLDYLTGIINYPIPLNHNEGTSTIKTNDCYCTVTVPGEAKIKKKLTLKQAELLKKYLEILTK